MATDALPQSQKSNAEDKISETSGDTSHSLESSETDKSHTGPGTIKDLGRKLHLKMTTLRTLASPKKTDGKPAVANKNEPSRFLGEGVSFKAKLIGILEVNEARGDRMCQDALADLKMAIRAAGEHKQRITINIAIDGLRLRDEKTGDCLFHHPVHKISFIAQDMSDSRAFGYIFGSPDTGHRFFGIKTDKAASQVVIAMRDLFQVVFELKKKEIEMAKQHIEQQQIKISSAIFMDSGPSSKNGPSSSDHSSVKIRAIHDDNSRDLGNVVAAEKQAQQTPEVIADLLDLEFELNNIQQGIHQMERITPSDPFGPSSNKDDPFGDSFSSSTYLPPPPKTQKPKQITPLPPPPCIKDTVVCPESLDSATSSRRSGSRNVTHQVTPVATVSAPASVQQAAPPQQEKHWFDRETESLFEEGELVTPPLTSTSLTMTATIPPRVDQIDQEMSNSSPKEEVKMPFDIFTELDPLGTGRSKPYIDRKDFFQELKNPPKKVLKDMVSETPNDGTGPLFQVNFDPVPTVKASKTLSSSNAEVVQLNSSSTALTHSSSSPKPSCFEVDPFIDTDPFYKVDPFENDTFVPEVSLNSVDSFVVAPEPLPNIVNRQDSFNTSFADFTAFEKPDKAVSTSSRTEVASRKKSPQFQPSLTSANNAQQSFQGPLRVSLPPEKVTRGLTSSSISTPSSQQTLVISSPAFVETLGTARSKIAKLHKQKTTAGFVKMSSPKSSHKFERLTKQTTIDVYSSIVNPSPSPPTTPTLLKNEKRSPLMENISHGDRISVTSPPVVACFPDGVDTDNSSRMSGSSIELSEFAPEPPPRPINTVIPIVPPPLPPKRQQPSETFRPPPKFQDDRLPHYDYIENYETSSPTLFESSESSEMKSPPIPVPARRPRFVDEFSSAVNRQKRQFLKQSEPDYVPPFPLLPPPQKKSPSVDTSKQQDAMTITSLLHSHSVSSATKEDDQHSKTAGTSLDITLSQLTKTGLGELATILGVSSTQLSNMTLQEFTKYLSQLSNANQNPEEEIQESKNVKREKYATLRESVDEEPTFKAEFEAHFDNEPTEKLEDVFQEAPFDKYAVFRELIEKECIESSTMLVHGEENEQQNESSKSPPELVTETLAQTETAESNDKNISDDMKEDNHVESQSAEDRYAALRDISLSKINVEKEDIDTSSEKEKSIGDSVKIDDDDDLLVSSRQQSESTESPTLDTTVAREPQSVIKSTILEEEAGVLEEDIKEELKTVDPENINIKIRPDNIEKRNVDILHEKEDCTNSTDIKMKEHNLSSEGWAKFDAAQFESGKPVTEVHSEGGLSPWSSDGKEFSKISTSWKEQFEVDRNTGRRRKKGLRCPKWQEPEESEERWDDKTDRSWRENGWSDGESQCGDSTPGSERMYRGERRGRRRRISPWKGRQPQDNSAWSQGDRSEEEIQRRSRRWQERYMDEEDDDDEEEYDVSWKSKPRHRGSSWDDPRRRRHGAREIDSGDYDDGYRRRPSPWRGERERRGSWDSVSYDEDEKFQPREYVGRRFRSDDYRRRWEGEIDSRIYAWSRKLDDDDYVYPEQIRHRKARYYRERSRESPLEDEYSEHGEDEIRYTTRKRSWPKRPSSASEASRNSDKNSLSDYKSRLAEKQQHSLPTAFRSESGNKSPIYNSTDWRYRDRYNSRARSRDEHFACDQDYDYWSSQERVSRKTDMESGYEQRSQTLQPKRPQRSRKSQEQSLGKKSPFDDDFTLQAFEFITDKKTEEDKNHVSNTVQNKSPIPKKILQNVFSEYDIEIEKQTEETVPNSSIDSKDHETPDDLVKSRLSKGSNHRQSPFEDDFTPAENRQVCARLISSVSSDISDYPRSPFEEARSGCRVENVAEETVCDSDVEYKAEKASDEVFLPSESIEDINKDSLFGQGDSDAFAEKVDGNISGVQCSESRLSSSVWSSEESNKPEKSSLGMKLRMSNLFRADSSSSLRKSESINIFARETDPFDDDFFQGSTPVTLPRPRQEGIGAKSSSNSSGDPFKWTRAFETFNFEEEDEM